MWGENLYAFVWLVFIPEKYSAMALHDPDLRLFTERNPASHSATWMVCSTHIIQAVVSNMFYSPPDLGMIPILTDIFQMGWFNHQLVTSNVVEVAVLRVWNGWTQGLNFILVPILFAHNKITWSALKEESGTSFPKWPKGKIKSVNMSEQRIFRLWPIPWKFQGVRTFWKWWKWRWSSPFGCR